MAYHSDSFLCHSERSEESRLLLTCNNQILRFSQDDKKSLCHSLFPSFHSDPGTLLIHLYIRHIGPSNPFRTIHPSLIARTSAARSSTGITGSSPLFLGTRDSKHLVILCSCFHSVFIGPIVLKRNKINVLLQKIYLFQQQMFVQLNKMKN